MRYPKHYPSQCPPKDSFDADGTFYRAIKGEEPTQDDFLSYWLLKDDKAREGFIKTGKACESCGLSVNANIDDLKSKLDVVPSLRKMNIAEGTLETRMGKIKPTPSQNDTSHHTWWVPISVKDASAFFKVVA